LDREQEEREEIVQYPLRDCRVRTETFALIPFRRLNPAGFLFAFGGGRQPADLALQVLASTPPAGPAAQIWRPTAVHTFVEGPGG
jgi:hypothetical protein